jgi:hypothetical protein
VMSTPLIIIIALFFCASVARYLRTRGIWPKTAENDSAKPQTAFAKWRNRVLIGVGVALILVVFWEKYQIEIDKRNPVNLPISATEYIWPEGCENKNYAEGDKISYNCRSKKYYMRSSLKYKFDGHIEYYNKTPNYYYRIENDAYSINCFVSGCFVDKIHRHVFKVKNDD